MVSLTPFTKAHITPKYLGWLNDKHLVRFSENRHRTHTEESAVGYFEAMREHLFWAVMDGTHVGNITAYLDRTNEVADLAILMGQPGRGIGAQAWKLAIDRVFSETSVRKIEAGTMSTNLGMLALFDKSGMVIEGRRVGHFMTEDGTADLVEAGIFRAALNKHGQRDRLGS